MLQPVVAPQSRVKTTALFAPEGDKTLETGSFAHMALQPASAAVHVTAMAKVHVSEFMRPNV